MTDGSGGSSSTDSGSANGALGLVYGDQGLVVSRAAFDAVGGYPSWPIMEDVGILERLRKVSRIRRLPACVVTSPRRYEAEGRWFGWLRNASLIALYRLGVPPARLARWYPRDGRPERDRQSPSRDRPSSDTEARLDGQVPPLPEDRGAVEERWALIVFAKVPQPGRVKTRLAADLGAQKAAQGVPPPGPPGAGRGKRRTLPDPRVLRPARRRSRDAGLARGESLEFRPQTGGDLGERMARAFDEALRDADRACIVGTDVPALGAALVVQALERLESADVVLGPAEDGGYYLMALSRPHPEIFRDVPWSTADVLGATLERTRRAGLRESLLPLLKDVDTAADCRPTSSDHGDARLPRLPNRRIRRLGVCPGAPFHGSSRHPSHPGGDSGHLERDGLRSARWSADYVEWGDCGRGREF